MRRPRPLPGALRGSAFSVSDARAAGVSADRLRASDLSTPFWGARAERGAMPAITDGSPGAARLRVRRDAEAYAPVMRPDEFFSHATGAVLHDLPLPPGLPPVLHVSALEPGRPPRRPGIAGHRERHLREAEVVLLGGLRVAPASLCWARLPSAVHPYDLVAVADRLLTADGEGGAMPDRLLSVATTRGLVGRPALQLALRRARRGAESRTETWTRLVLVDAGLPEPSLQHPVGGGADFRARLDLAYPRERVAVEYDGGQHRADALQFARDIDRLDRLAELGWRVVRVDAHLLFRRPAELVRRVAEALGRARPSS